MAKEKAPQTIAEQWVNRIDGNSPDKMQEEAVSEVELRGCWVYIFDDGSSVYEKRRGDWYPYEQFVQCPSCEEWREGDETVDCDDCAQAEAEDEEVTASLKSKVLCD